MKGQENLECHYDYYYNNSQCLVLSAVYASPSINKKPKMYRILRPVLQPARCFLIAQFCIAHQFLYATSVVTR